MTNLPLLINIQYHMESQTNLMFLADFLGFQEKTIIVNSKGKIFLSTKNSELYGLWEVWRKEVILKENPRKWKILEFHRLDLNNFISFIIKLYLPNFNCWVILWLSFRLITYYFWFFTINNIINSINNIINENLNFIRLLRPLLSGPHIQPKITRRDYQ